MDTKQRIVERAAGLFWRQGYPATGMKQIVAEAGAPFGSVYHFFPGGKEELGAEAVRWAGAQYAAIVLAHFDPALDVADATEGAFAGAAETLRQTDFADACPIATVALEMSSASEVIRLACAETFEGWTAGLAHLFAAGGIEDAAARRTALAVLSLLEGAFVLCRATRRTEAIDAAGPAAGELVRAARIAHPLPAATPARRRTRRTRGGTPSS